MLLLLFALSVHAQPFNGNNYGSYGNNFYSVGTPTLNGPQFPPAAGPSAFDFRQAAFDRRQADRNVWASQADYRGNNIFYNVPLPTLFPNAAFDGFNSDGFLDFGAYSKASSDAQNERRMQLEINHFRATHPRMTWEDRNKLDDLILQRDAFHNQKLRRTLSISDFSPAGPYDISSVFDVRGKALDANLAQNELYDARQSIREDRSRDNIVELRNAREGVAQADLREDAARINIFGSDSGFYHFSPILKKKASQIKLDTGYRNLRTAQQKYLQDPSEDNRLEVQLADLFIRATEEEDESNKGAIVSTSLANSNSRLGLLSVIASAKNEQDESRLWLKYNRLKRQILLRKQAQEMQGGGSGSGSAADQLMSGSNRATQTDASAIN